MKALRKIHTGEGGVQLFHDMPIPEPGPGQIKIKVIYGSLCGTDIHIREDAFPVQMPVTMGHEYSAIVDAVGEGVTDFQVGDRVVSMAIFDYCGACDYCRKGLYMLCKEKKGFGTARNGAFAEYAVLPARNVFKIPEGLSLKEAALCEPLACAVRGVLERCTVGLGDYVYVSGPGVMGQFVAQLAKLAGAYVTVAGTSMDTERLALARELGADDTFDVMTEDPIEHAEKATNGHGYDIAFECSGSFRGVDTCFDVLRKTGHFQQIALYGKPIQVNLDKALLKEINIGNFYAAQRSSFEKLMVLLAHGQLKIAPFCDTVLDLEDWEKGMSMMEHNEAYKVLFRMNDDPEL